MVRWGIDASPRHYRISGASAASFEFKSNDKRSWSCEFNWKLGCRLELIGVFVVAVVGVGGSVVGGWWGECRGGEASNRRQIHIERRVGNKLSFKLILNYKAYKLSERFLKSVLAIVPAKICTKFRSYQSAVNVVEGLVVVARKVPPSRRRLESRTTMIPKGCRLSNQVATGHRSERLLRDIFHSKEHVIIVAKERVKPKECSLISWQPKVQKVILRLWTTVGV